MLEDFNCSHGFQGDITPTYPASLYSFCGYHSLSSKVEEISFACVSVALKKAMQIAYYFSNI